ncbi:terminase small subunit [Phyllobacterium sp. CL33Tsu]|uniref:terminase small subunit n=1 Tax=Phyllobacterium sp. CL33Tsu TaxID=1798191 RepID=UPI00158744BF|nr:terminase small subunit [Phyllobacterium sp. CL33Tsu]
MLTARQESFCRGLTEGLSQYEAYQKAGYRSKGRNATDAHAARLVRNGKVKNRLNELKSEAAKQTVVTAQSIAAELDIAFRLALDNRQAAACVAASMGKAKLFGLIVDRAEVEQIKRKPVTDPDAPTEMSLEVWQRKYGKISEH